MPEEREPTGDVPQEGVTGPGGSYEVIRQRLAGQGRALADKARELNHRRQEVFGGTELAVLGSERVRTENNCVPVDVVQVGGLMLFGYNVQIGLRKSIAIDDVFSAQRFAVKEDGTLEFSAAHSSEASFLADSRFQREFGALYQYYSATRLIALRNTGTKLLAVFQTGEAEDALKVFQWGIGRGAVEYIDDRGERAFVPPPTHDFEWTETTRADHVLGRHPHVSIEDRVFVETVGGDLTIKVEDNTEDGLGIYREDVDDPNQSLDDAAILYAIRGALVLLRVRPYMEEGWRHFAFNTRTQQALRIDAIGDSCVSLPEDHGVIFPGGYVLQTGEVKVFGDGDADLRFLRKVASPNGEDVLYVFNRRRDGLYVLFPYNLIRREVQTPIRCHGWSLFDDGRLIVFRAVDEPARVHPMQVWNTPYVSAEHAAAAPSDGSMVSRVGNKDLVRGISDCLTVGRMVVEQEPTRAVYEALVQACQRALDAYYWLSDEEAGGLAEGLAAVRDTAELVIDEFEKVQLLRRRADEAIADSRRAVQALEDDLRPDTWREAEQFMAALTALRTQRGQLITLRDVRYVERASVDAMEERVASGFERISRATVDFLLGDQALTPLTERIEELHGQVAGVERRVDMEPLMERQEELTAGLDLMTEVVSGLEIDDAVARASILERLGEVFGQLNRVRAVLSNRRKELAAHEARADFSAQWGLLGQSVSAAVALAESPEACDEQLSRLMMQLEELEARFGEFDEFLPQLADKREEIVEALGARKQVLVDARQKRAGNLVSAAERILAGVVRRARTFKSQDELNAWFASDAMVLKLRGLAEQLSGLGDAVKGEELLSRLSATRQDALRGLRDRLELFEGDGGDLIRLGKHRFPVNSRPLELTMLPRDGAMSLHLTGTDFYEAVDDPEVSAAQPYWEQSLASEGPGVSRAEYLAASLLLGAEEGRAGLSIQALENAARSKDDLLTLVRTYASERYDEGYERGVHDHDAALLLHELLRLRTSAGLLRYAPRVRALAVLHWAWAMDGAARERTQRRARSFGRLRETLGHGAALRGLSAEVAAALLQTVPTLTGLTASSAEATLAGAYLLEELQAEHPRFVISAEAEALSEALAAHLDAHGGRGGLDDDLSLLGEQPRERLELALAWLTALTGTDSGEGVALEAAVRLLTLSSLDHEVSRAMTQVEVRGLISQHPRIREGRLELRLDEYLSRLTRWRGEDAVAFERWRVLRQRVLARERARLRLSEYEPKVMSAFVRNKLINEVYLPIVGDNLAKQMGSAGDSRRTDQMGLLLLVSPPGYGKTTLMEYIASRLGLVFMKVNGPALGHDVTSLDPAEAPNATARQEVEKINLAFEMANNVMLYLDDIQHTNPELLQKFISLCDGTRRIEGVWKGRTRTYDLRGKKFCVVMAGNPYTESGARFQIPDMLANRADTYNLGDILEGRDEAFALSYIENSLTSNPVLQPLATREQADVYKLVERARGEEVPLSELSHDYSSVELSEIEGVLRKLARVQQVVLAVNQQYIASAAQQDAFRSEPPFKLQGSYRNMNKLSEKIVPAMNDAELDALLRDHYLGEAQTLTTGAEANLLKLWELLGTLTEEQRRRWDEIKKEFRRAARMGGADDDPVTRITGVLGGLDRQLEGIRESLLAGRSDDLGEGIAGVSAQIASLGDQLRRGAEAMNQRGDLAARLDVIVSGVTEELTGIRAGIEGTARGLADLNVLEWLAAAPAAVRTRSEVASVQREVLQQAQAALRTDLRELGDPSALTPRSAVLAGTLPVIQGLFLRIGELLGSVSLSEEEWAGLMAELRRHVAEAVTELARDAE